MKKEVIIVPKDKCVLDVLAEMGERTKNSWIFFHKNVVKKLQKTADANYSAATVRTLIWNETEEFPKTELYIDISAKIWCSVIDIKATDIAFEKDAEDPENLYFFQIAI